MNLTLRAVTALVLLIASASRAGAFGPWTGAYRFEEGTGVTALDSSGLARHGTLTGAVGAPDYVAGLYAGSNSAVRFNYDATISDYDNSQLQRVGLPVNTAFVQNAPGVTMMAWVRPDVIANEGPSPLFGALRSIVSISDGVGGSARGVLQVLANTGQVRVVGRRVDGGPNAFYTTNGATPLSLTPGQTYFLVGVLDYVNADMRIYVNGVQHTGGIFAGLLNLGTPGPTNLSADTPNVMSNIGSNLQGVGEQWNGVIDGVRIFNRAVTSDEVLTTYNAEKIPEPTAMGLAVVAILGLAASRRRRMCLGVGNWPRMNADSADWRGAEKDGREKEHS